MRELIYKWDCGPDKMKRDLEIINRYLRGEAAPEERIRIMKMIDEDPSFRKEFLAMRKIYDALLISDDIGGLKKRVRRGMAVRILRFVASIAAAASLAVGVTYFIMSDKEVENIMVQRFEAPEGHRTEAVLSDGTMICLNSGSRLEILSSGKNERRVRLDGEAYLKVAHNEDRPFILETSEMEVKVLGTSFDVSTYGNVHSVVLVEGSVEVNNAVSSEKTVIEPDQMYVFDRSTGQSGVKQVDALSMVTWKDGYLNLQNMTVEELFSRLEHYYGVRIICSDDSKDTFTMSGKLILESRIDTVMDNLATLLDMKYSRLSEDMITVCRR